MAASVIDGDVPAQPCHKAGCARKPAALLCLSKLPMIVS